MKSILFLILIILVIGVLFIFFKKFSSSNISDDELAKIINNDAFLVDVRSPQEFQSGSVKGAVNIPLQTISQNIAQFQDKKQIVVFCRSGARASQAKSILNKNGINNVTNGGSWGHVNELKK